MQTAIHKALKINIIWIFILSTFTVSQVRGNEQEKTLNYYLASLLNDPVQLRLFLQKMPKGADLHTHFDGAIYAESYLQWAALDNKCFDLELQSIVATCESNNPKVISAEKVVNDGTLFNAAIDSLSVRNYQLGTKSGHQQFFSTFGRFSAAISGREGHMLAEIAQRAAKQHITALELQVVFGIFEAASLASEFKQKPLPDQVGLAMQHSTLTDAREKTIEQVDLAEATMRSILKCDSQTPQLGCDVKISYLSTIIRVLPEGSMTPQAALAFSLVDSDERFVGVNIAAPEDNLQALSRYKRHMEIFALLAENYPKVANKLSLHAGELTLGLVDPKHLTDNIHDAVSIAKAKRIGHGTSIVYELDKHKDLLKNLKESSVLIEINLTSNEVILGVSHEYHPLPLYLANNVPVALSTDDEGIARIDLTHEYQIAAQRYKLPYTTLKSLSRNSLEYSFLNGLSLFEDYPNLTVNSKCTSPSSSLESESDECFQFLEDNDKAKYQKQLEIAFDRFERDIIEDIRVFQ
ncbi:MAG: hypothetical protein ABJV04_08730 [Aliiglaciecola sp.]|uniref:hypothetical protein n=1 Tax=Aliiglaciecola sp. TaxID=1872441 RepID=UPI00329A072C